MGSHASAHLAYGYSLGGGEEGWNVEEADEYGCWEPAWADGEDIVDAAECRLLQIVGGFTESDWKADGYFERKRAAKARAGVEFVNVGYCESGGSWILAARKVEVGDFGETVVDLDELESERVSSNWNALLEQAAQVLEFTPKTEPAWILAASYG